MTIKRNGVVHVAEDKVMDGYGCSPCDGCRFARWESPTQVECVVDSGFDQPMDCPWKWATHPMSHVEWAKKYGANMGYAGLTDADIDKLMEEIR